MNKEKNQEYRDIVFGKDLAEVDPDVARSICATVTRPNSLSEGDEQCNMASWMNQVMWDALRAHPTT